MLKTEGTAPVKVIRPRRTGNVQGIMTGFTIYIRDFFLKKEYV